MSLPKKFCLSQNKVINKVVTENMPTGYFQMLHYINLLIKGDYYDKQTIKDHF